MKSLILAGTIACLATPAFADVLLNFGQTSASNTITATPNAGNTATAIAGNNVAVDITQILGGSPTSALFTLSLNSTGAAFTLSGSLAQRFGGSFCITAGAGCTGTNYLSGTFTDLVVGGGTSVALSASEPPDSIALTSDVIPAAELDIPGAFSLAFSNADPSVGEVGDTLGGFTAAVAGNLSATPVPTPEPASLALLGVGMLGIALVRRRA